VPIDRRDPTRPNTSGQQRRLTDPDFLTPGDLCARWRIDLKTLNKFSLPWIVLAPRLRRIELAVIEEFEVRQRLATTT